jgi:predicted P-loop ATPase
MSRRWDKARPAYAHSPRIQPRRCVFVGTTNDGQYMQDEENRRFWPVKIGRIDLQAFDRDCEQLHAEAVRAVVRNGETAVLPQELWAVATQAQRERRIEDPWEDELMTQIMSEIAGETLVPKSLVTEIDHKGRRVWFIRSSLLLGDDILNIPVNQQKGFEGRRLKTVMERLGWSRALVTSKSLGSRPARGYIREVAEGPIDKDYLAMFGEGGQGFLDSENDVTRE